MRTIALSSFFLLVACESSEQSLARNALRDASALAAEPSSASDAAPRSGEVRWYGNLKSVFSGDWSRATTISEAAPTTAAYALGALTELRGEFLVIGGNVMLAYPTETALPRVTGEHGSSGETATLLVAADVPRWREFAFEAGVLGDAIEDAIRAKAGGNGVDVSKPFPFLLRGLFRNIEWHVADGTRVEPGMRPDTNAQHGTLAEAEGTIVGFYSTQHQGVFTMMGQNTHMHIVSSDHSLLGHVRTLDVTGGCLLSLP